MRRIKRSATFVAEFQALLAQGLPKFSSRVVSQKRDLVEDFVRTILIEFPGIGTIDPDIGLHTYGVRRTPFVIAYDIDDAELRLHTIFHEHADRARIDPLGVVW